MGRRRCGKWGSHDNWAPETFEPEEIQLTEAIWNRVILHKRT